VPPYIVTVAGAIDTAYTGLLGFLYKTAFETVTLPATRGNQADPALGDQWRAPPDYIAQTTGYDDHGFPVVTALFNHRSGLVAVLPEVFIALALALAAGYLSFIRRNPPQSLRPPSPLLRVQNQNRLNDYITWVTTLVDSRAVFLRMAVISLAVSVALLPIPFVHVWTETAVWLLLDGLMLVPGVAWLGGPHPNASVWIQKRRARVTHHAT